ncbi:MAG: tetratricopeptide repeat protein [Bacteroidales bacterium]
MKSAKLFVPILLAVLFFSQIQAQQSQDAVAFRSKADDYILAEDYVNALFILDSAMLAEFTMDDPDLLFLAACCSESGDYYKMLGYYGVAVFYYDLSMGFYQKSGDTSEARAILSQINLIYNGIRSEDFSIDLGNGRETSEQKVYFRIVEITRQNNDSLWAIVNAGTNDGIFLGGTGDARGIYREQYADRSDLLLGYAEVVQTGANQSTVSIHLHETTDSANLLYEGDMVRLPARIVVNENPGVFFKLASLTIDFIDSYSDFFYDCRHLFFFDNTFLEEVLLLKMQFDILETADLVAPLADDNPAWTEPANTGRFKGVGMLEAMNQTKPDDIRAFLEFVADYPGKYMGHTWKINETYSTWLLNECPISKSELKQMLLDAPDDNSFAEIIKSHKNDIYDDSLFDDWYNETKSLSDQGRYVEAEQMGEFIIRVSKALNDTLFLAWSYYAKAGNEDDQKQFEEGAEDYYLAITLFKVVDELSGQSLASHNLARMYDELGNYTDALRYYNESIELNRKQLLVNNADYLNENMGLSHQGKGSCLYNLSRYKEASDAFEEGIKYYSLVQTEDGILGKATLLGWLGRVSYTIGNYDIALDYFDQQMQIYTDRSDFSAQADVYDNIAYVSSLKGNEKLANEQYRQAYELNNQAGDTDGAGFSMSNVGQTYWTLGEYIKAIDAHELSIELRIAANNIKGQAYSWSKLGDLYKESGDPKKALESFNKAVDLYDEAGDPKAKAEVYESLGGTFYDVKDYPKALEYYFAARDLYKSINAVSEYATSLTNIGNTYYNDKKYDQAHAYFIQSLELQKGIDDKSGQMYNYINLGQIDQFFDFDYEEAEKNYNEAIRFAEEIESKSYIAHCKSMLGSLYSSKGEFDKGLQVYTEALDIYNAIGEKSAAAGILNSMGLHFSTFGKFDKAVEVYNEAKETGLAINNRNVVV